MKEHPDWRALPAVVVAEEKPQAFILWVNEKARRLGIRPGHRYAAGLALSRELRAGAVAEDLVRQEVMDLTECLRHFTPEVEPAGTWQLTVETPDGDQIPVSLSLEEGVQVARWLEEDGVLDALQLTGGHTGRPSF